MDFNKAVAVLVSLSCVTPGAGAQAVDQTQPKTYGLQEPGPLVAATYEVMVGERELKSLWELNVG